MRGGKGKQNPSVKRIELPLGEPARTYTGTYHPPNCFVFSQERYKCPILFLNHGLNRFLFYFIYKLLFLFIFILFIFSILCCSHTLGNHD